MTDLRADGAAALDWAASYPERVGELPVLAQVEPGEIRARLPATAPEQPEPFANVLRDLDEVLLPGVTHWRHPRYFAYFATRSRPDEHDRGRSATGLGSAAPASRRGVIRARRALMEFLYLAAITVTHGYPNRPQIGDI